jgi:hypothetical protein
MNHPKEQLEETAIDYRIEVWLENGRCWEPVGGDGFLNLDDAIEEVRDSGIEGWDYRILRVERTVMHGWKERK